MPLIQVTMIEGRSPAMKEDLIRLLTRSTVEAIGAPHDSVRVILQEVPSSHWGVGGVSKSAFLKEISNG